MLCSLLHTMMHHQPERRHNVRMAHIVLAKADEVLVPIMAALLDGYSNKN
jgi:hypothetical protein